MPEYLAPGVYIEERSSGNKPIESVSTSTAGMVGVTQRGPVNDPTLITGAGQFNRVFGGLLDHRGFTEGRDSLPYAVQGFFTNGGQRVYVSRIVGAAATFASVDLLGIPAAAQASTKLSASSAKGSDVIAVDDPSNVDTGNVLLLEDDVRSEYVTVQAPPIVAGVRLHGALRNDHAAAAAVTIQAQNEDADLTAEITGDMAAGGGLALSAAAVAALLGTHILRLSDPNDKTLTEFVTISADADAAFDEVTLLFDHPQASTEIHRVSLQPGAGSTLLAAASDGDEVLRLNDAAPFNDGDAVRIGSELHVVRNTFSTISILTTPLQNNHAADMAVTRQVPLLRVHAMDQGLQRFSALGWRRIGLALIRSCLGLGESVRLLSGSSSAPT